MAHFITMGIRDIDRTPVFKFMGEIHMPLFFFISGWFCLRLNRDGIPKAPNFARRFLQLVVPMVVVSSLWIYYFPHSGLQSPFDSSFSGLWSDMWKNGYWFTLCLFEIILIYATLRPVLNKCQKFGSQVFLSFIAYLLLFGVFVLIDGTTVCNVLEFDLVMSYFPAFMAGCLFARNQHIFNRALQSALWRTIALVVGAFSLYYLCWWWEFPFTFQINGNEYTLIYAFRPIFHICLAVIAFAIVRQALPKLENSVCAKNTVGCLSYIGVNSLGIYLLHYFFLFPAGFMREWLIGLNLAFVPVFFVSLIVAILIIAVILGIMKILALSPFLDFLLTGNLKSSRK